MSVPYQENFEGRVAIVTGASRGIGEEVAFQLGVCGAKVIGTATTVGGAEKITQNFVDAGLEGIGAVLDLSRPETFGDFKDLTEAHYENHPTILVNNGGKTLDDLAMRMSPEYVKDVIDTDLTGPMILTNMFLRGMLRAKQGNVVSIGSVVGTVGEAGQSNYAAAKRGIEGATMSWAKELGAKGLRFNVVAPGYVLTDMTASLSAERIEQVLGLIPLGRAIYAEEIADCVRRVIDSEEYAKGNGTTIPIDGGLTEGSIKLPKVFNSQY